MLDVGQGMLEWLLANTYDLTALQTTTHLVTSSWAGGVVLAVGPHHNFQTA